MPCPKTIPRWKYYSKQNYGNWKARDYHNSSHYKITSLGESSGVKYMPHSAYTAAHMHQLIKHWCKISVDGGGTWLYKFSDEVWGKDEHAGTY